MARRHSGEFTGSERGFGFLERAMAVMAGLALAIPGAGLQYWRSWRRS